MDEVRVVWGTDADGRPSAPISVWDSEEGARSDARARGGVPRGTLGDWRTVWAWRHGGLPVGTMYVDRLPLRRLEGTDADG